jgi:hypothetical protein
MHEHAMHQTAKLLRELAQTCARVARSFPHQSGAEARFK